MVEKNIKTRIINKHDTETNWKKATGFIPKQGELIVYDADDTYNHERFKVGDGINNPNNLPFFNVNGQYPQSITGTAAVTTPAASYNHTKWEATIEGIDGDNLYTGLQILYKVPVAGNGTYGTGLSINGGEYHPVVANVNTMISTRYSVGCIISLIYDAAQTSTLYVTGTSTTFTGCWKIADYDSNTTITYGTLAYYFRPYTAAKLSPYQLGFLNKDNKFVPICSNEFPLYASGTTYAKDAIVFEGSYGVYKSLQASNKGHAPHSYSAWWEKLTTPHTPTTLSFRPDKCYWYNTTTTVNANEVIGGNTLMTVGYNATNMPVANFNASLPTYRIIYLCGTYDTTTGLFTLNGGGTAGSTAYYTFVPDNTSNITLSSYFTAGKDYILVGASYSTANYMHLREDNLLFHFDGTNLLPYDTWRSNNKQNTLESGVNIKTIHGESILGEGNIDVVGPTGPTGAQGPIGNTGATGATGAPGATGTAAGFGTPTATIDNNVGTPQVTVTTSGPNTAKIFNFQFKNLKGIQGNVGPTGPAGSGGSLSGPTGAIPVGNGSSVDWLNAGPTGQVLTIGPSGNPEYGWADRIQGYRDDYGTTYFSPYYIGPSGRYSLLLQNTTPDSQQELEVISDNIWGGSLKLRNSELGIDTLLDRTVRGSLDLGAIITYLEGTPLTFTAADISSSSISIRRKDIDFGVNPQYIGILSDIIYHQWADSIDVPINLDYSAIVGETTIIPGVLTFHKSTSEELNPSRAYTAHSLLKMPSAIPDQYQGTFTAEMFVNSDNDDYVSFFYQCIPFTAIGNLADSVDMLDSQKISKITSSTDNAVVRFDGTGSEIQNSAVTIDDNGNLTTSGGLILYAPSGDSPRLTFQRGTLSDNYNDWSLYDSSGYLYIQQRGSGATAWETRATFTQSAANFVGTLQQNGLAVATQSWANEQFLTEAPVTDVQVNGTSVVSNKVANIPAASTSTAGVVTTGEQTFSGNKHFSNNIYSYGSDGLVAGLATNTKYKVGEINNRGFALTLPLKQGTLATLDDIPPNAGVPELTTATIRIYDLDYGIYRWNYNGQKYVNPYGQSGTSTQAVGTASTNNFLVYVYNGFQMVFGGACKSYIIFASNTSTNPSLATPYLYYGDCSLSANATMGSCNYGQFNPVTANDTSATAGTLTSINIGGTNYAVGGGGGSSAGVYVSSYINPAATSLVSISNVSLQSGQTLKVGDLVIGKKGTSASSAVSGTLVISKVTNIISSYYNCSIEYDSTALTTSSVTSGSTALVTSGGVYTAIQNAITTALNNSY